MSGQRPFLGQRVARGDTPLSNSDRERSGLKLPGKIQSAPSTIALALRRSIRRERLIYSGPFIFLFHPVSYWQTTARNVCVSSATDVQVPSWTWTAENKLSAM